MSRKTIIYSLLLICCLGAGWLWRLDSSQPLRIGYVADLNSELGIAGRDGCLLAIEEMNAAGGINDHLVELVVESNGGEQQHAWSAVQKLLEADVHAIVGHMTSEMSFSTRELIEQAGIVMLSPTNATDLLSGRNDNFLRIYPSASSITGKLASYAYRRGLKNFAVLYDQSNYAYTKSMLDGFTRDVDALGGQVEEAIPFDGKNLQTSFLTLVQQINDACVDGVLILANPMQTALIVQQFNKVACQAELFATEWSYSPTLISYGGGIIENLTIVQTYLPEALDPKSLALKERMRQRFDQPVWFASAHAYDATRLLLAALARDDDRNELKKNLLSFGAFEGVQSSIKLDEYGDAERIFFVRKIADGKISLVAQL